MSKDKTKEKVRPCLRCDHPFKSTPENRICSGCKPTVEFLKGGIFTGHALILEQEGRVLKKKGAD